MDRFKVLFPCFPTSGRERSIQLPTGTANFQHISEKAAVQPFSRSVNEPDICSDKAALSIVSAMLDADKAGPSLDTTIQSLVHQAGGWSQYLAEKILAAIEAVLKSGKQMNAAMQEACDKACEAAKMIEGFAADHPFATTVFCTVIALGVLVVLAPYALEWLGFSELGPIEGTWAALWQSRYEGLVPKGSLFSFFQRLGFEGLVTWESENGRSPEAEATSR